MSHTANTRYPLLSAAAAAAGVYFFASLAGGYVGALPVLHRVVLAVLAIVEALVSVNHLLEWYRRRLERRVAERATQVAREIGLRGVPSVTLKDARWEVDGSGTLHLIGIPGVAAEIGVGLAESRAAVVEPGTDTDGDGRGSDAKLAN